MMIGILIIALALIAGILAGTLTGLSPGIHINLVASVLVASSAFFNSFSIPLIALAVFIASMSITHTFLDFIPSIFLGAPEEDSFLSILPGHRMLKEGRGYDAFVITIYGSLFALLVITLFTPIFLAFLPNIYTIVKTAIPFILIFISIYLIFREGNFLISIVVFILAGFLGFLAFNLPVQQPLMPLLSGLFGLSGLIISLKSKTQIPKQKISPLRKIKLTKREFFKSALAVLISSPFCSFLPGIGSGHAATIGSEIIPQDTKGFLFLVGATNTIVMGLSFITVYAIEKSRSGSAAAIEQILGTITQQNLIIILVAMLISGILAAILGLSLAKLCARHISKIKYTYITLFTISTLLIFNFIFTNWLGILILATATALGIFAISSESRRINLMGALIIPAIIYYLL
jgi:putative membrane protein